MRAEEVEFIMDEEAMEETEKQRKIKHAARVLADERKPKLNPTFRSLFARQQVQEFLPNNQDSL